MSRIGFISDDSKQSTH